MADMGSLLANFGNRGGLLSRMEQNRGVQVRNNLAEYSLGAAQRGEQRMNTLGELYGKARAGDQSAIDAMARVDPKFAMGVETHQAGLAKEQQAVQTQQQEQIARQAIWANSEDKWQATPFAQQGIPFNQREMVIGQFIGNEGAFNAQQEQTKFQYGQQKDAASLGLQERGLDLTARGQNISLRGQDLTNARALEKNSLDKEIDTFKDANTLRDEFNTASKDFIKVRDAYSRIQASAANPSAAGDMSMIFNYMKILDPGSTVREGEFATAQQATGVPGQILNAYNRALSGERLSPDQRADFVNQAGGLYTAQEQGHLQLRGEYERLANRRGVDPQDVVVDYRYQQDGGQSEVEASQQINGRSYVKIGGQWYEQ